MRINDLMKRFPKGDPPFQVDVRKALDSIIGKDRVYRIPFSRNIDGMLVFIEGEAFVLINSAQPERRIRWTEAHELAEYFLHKETVYQSVYFSLHTKDILSEKAVNNLAAEMLMPEFVLKKFFAEFASLGIERSRQEIITYLSRRFFVSEEAVEFRLKSLGIFTQLLP